MIYIEVVAFRGCYGFFFLEVLNGYISRLRGEVLILVVMDSEIALR